MCSDPNRVPDEHSDRGLRTLQPQLYYSDVPADGRSWDPAQGWASQDQGLRGQLPSGGCWEGPASPQGERGGGAWVRTVADTGDKIWSPRGKDFFFWLHWVFVAACGLSLIAASLGLLFVAVRGLLIAVASLVVEHGL